MNEWFDTSIKLQRQMLDTHKQVGDAGTALIQAQEATRRAAEANVAAWQAWARLWGGGPW